MAIARAIEKELGNRQGQRTDLELTQDFAEVKGKESAQIAAQQSGLVE